MDWPTQQTVSALLAALGTLAVALPKALAAWRALRGPRPVKRDPAIQRIDEATTALLWVHADHPMVSQILRERSAGSAPAPSPSGD